MKKLSLFFLLSVFLAACSPKEQVLTKEEAVAAINKAELIQNMETIAYKK